MILVELFCICCIVSITANLVGQYGFDVNAWRMAINGLESHVFGVSLVISFIIAVIVRYITNKRIINKIVIVSVSVLVAFIANLTTAYSIRIYNESTEFEYVFNFPKPEQARNYKSYVYSYILTGTTTIKFKFDIASQLFVDIIRGQKYNEIIDKYSNIDNANIDTDVLLEYIYGENTKYIGGLIDHAKTIREYKVFRKEVVVNQYGYILVLIDLENNVVYGNYCDY